MFARALIVLLLVLNVGVAAWWAMRPASQPAAIIQPDGVARLQLLSEAALQAGQTPPALAASPGAPNGQGTAAASADHAADPTAQTATATQDTDIAKASAPDVGAVAPSAAAPAAVVDKSLCFSLGPFTNTDAAQAANAQLLPLVRRAVVRTRTASPVRGWRVVMPPLSTQEAAKAAAKRIADAGFSDYLVMHDGADANGIALGRYSSEVTARRRVQALATAGFATRAEPLGGGPATIWLDIVAAPGFDAAHAQSITKAPGREPLDCARLE